MISMRATRRKLGSSISTSFTKPKRSMLACRSLRSYTTGSDRLVSLSMAMAPAAGCAQERVHGSSPEVRPGSQMFSLYSRQPLLHFPCKFVPLQVGRMSRSQCDSHAFGSPQRSANEPKSSPNTVSWVHSLEHVPMVHSLQVLLSRWAR